MRTRDWLLLILLAVLWGFSYFFVAIALKGGVPPLTLVLARVSLAALVLVPVALAFGYAMPSGWANWRLFAVQSVLNNVFPFSMMVYGQTKIGSSLASVLNATTPLFTLLVARVLAGEPLTFNRTAGVLFGLAGVGILVGPEIAGSNLGTLLGMSAFLGAALFYGISAQWMKRLREVPPIVSAASQLTCSSIIMLPIAAVTERFWQLPVPPVYVLASVVGVALLATALAYIVFFKISASAGPQNVMLVTLLIPVSASALGVIFLGEALTVHQVLGAIVIAFGLLVVDGRVLSYLPLRAR